MSRPLAVWPSCFTLRPVPAIRAAAWGAPLGGAGTLPNLYVERERRMKKTSAVHGPQPWPPEAS